MKLFKILICVLIVTAFTAMPADSKTKNKAGKASTTKVIFTGDLANKVYGYNGKTPVNIHIKDGKIEKIEVLPNEETPQYLKRAVAKICPQYEGKSIAEAKKVHADVATGATYSSEALIKNIQMGLDQVDNTGKTSAKRKK